jgi:hypothetical protein
LEIKNDGYYAEDICDLLHEEFCQSQDLSPYESNLLIDALNKWQTGECRPKQIKLIERVLFEKQGFILEFAKYTKHVLRGGSKNNF